tara:strand:- start:327 stop:599 length:273 start_codon:yes stop_codon:yes gene_type:complete
MRIGKYSIYLNPLQNNDAEEHYFFKAIVFRTFKFILLIGSMAQIFGSDSPVGFFGQVLWFFGVFIWLFWEELRRLHISKKIEIFQTFRRW